MIPAKIYTKHTSTSNYIVVANCGWLRSVNNLEFDQLNYLFLIYIYIYIYTYSTPHGSIYIYIYIYICGDTHTNTLAFLPSFFSFLVSLTIELHYSPKVPEVYDETSE
jgi:hypothetical protein